MFRAKCGNNTGRARARTIDPTRHFSHGPQVATFAAGTFGMAGSLGPVFLLGDGVADTPDSCIAGDRPGDLVIVLALVLVCIVFICVGVGSGRAGSAATTTSVLLALVLVLVFV